jgi:hypothetical protein
MVIDKFKQILIIYSAANHKVCPFMLIPHLFMFKWMLTDEGIEMGVIFIF